MKILVKNAVQRKEGYLYSIDEKGNLVETKLLDLKEEDFPRATAPGPWIFNIKKSLRTSGTQQFNNKKSAPLSGAKTTTFKSINFSNKLLNIKKSYAHVGSRDSFSTLRKSFHGRNLEINSTLRNPSKRRMSAVQVRVLEELSAGPAELKLIVEKLGALYFGASIYRSINNLVNKKLIEKKRRGEYGYGPILISKIK